MPCKTSRSGTRVSIEKAREEIRCFSGFRRIYPDEFGDLTMWYWDGDSRSGNYPPAVIPDSLVRPHVFIFLGALQPRDSIDLVWIADDFDRLLPLS